jgi:methionyl-tRNA synthetase
VKFFITTAIDYPSSEPHLGHAYEKVCADVIARYKRLRGFKVHFSTGTDEHGLKIQRYAEAAGKKPKEFVDEMATKFREMCDLLNISYDDFIRTTEPRHEQMAREIFKKLWEAGDIYKGRYEGYYCAECETYYNETELVEGKCPVHLKPAEWMSEECYFFRMGKYREKILEHILTHPEFIRPPERAREVLKRLEQPLRDLCVSRSTFDWGIKLPIDEKHIMYVWVDALTNYLTTASSGEWWPADLHLIGKDISWHHCVIWTAMLLSAGLPLPKQIFVHGFVTIGGEKLSKSRGTKVNPIELVRRYSADAVRYFLIRHIPFGSDGEFTEEALIQRLNTELADGLGNFAHRVLSFINSRFGGKVPDGKVEEEIKRKILESVEEIERLMDELELTKALEKAFSLVSLGNEYFQSKQPWKGGPETGDCLLTSINLLKTLCVILYPFLPSSCTKLAEMCGFKIESWEQAKSLDLKPGHEIRPPEPLFQKISPKPLEQEQEISLEDFAKLNLRVAEIESAERIEGSDKLLKLVVKLDGEKRTVVAGIGKKYTPEELLGKQVVLLTNLKPRKIMGILSQGMILAAGETDEEVSLLIPDKRVKPNTRIR